MATLGKYYKTPTERKRYMVDYDDWLDINETVDSIVFAVTPAGELEVDAFSINVNGRAVVFFVDGGDNLNDYVVNVKATTSGGQLKEDDILFDVREL